MEDYPNKWKKHLLLVQFGLKSQTDLENEIKRYNKNDIESLIYYLRKNLCNNSINNSYIISLIPQIEYFKLPNYLVKCQEDIDGIFKFIMDKKVNFSEIWCCEKIKRDNIDNVVGRIVLKTGISYTNEVEQIIEQVWSVNHRDIEKYQSNTHINYLRASRDGWNRRYHIDQINIVNSKNKEIMLNDFINVAKNIENKRELIENWLVYLNDLNIPEIALEYMLINDNFRFIDWDTANDKKVIDSIFKESRER